MVYIQRENDFVLETNASLIGSVAPTTMEAEAGDALTEGIELELNVEMPDQGE